MENFIGRAVSVQADVLLRPEGCDEEGGDEGRGGDQSHTIDDRPSSDSPSRPRVPRTPSNQVRAPVDATTAELGEALGVVDRPAPRANPRGVAESHTGVAVRTPPLGEPIANGEIDHLDRLAGSRMKVRVVLRASLSKRPASWRLDKTEISSPEARLSTEF